MKTLGDALPEEIQRVKSLLPHYAELGPVGEFGRMMLTREIEAAEKANAEQDAVAMLRAYEALKGCK